MGLGSTHSTPASCPTHSYSYCCLRDPGAQWRHKGMLWSRAGIFRFPLGYRMSSSQSWEMRRCAKYQGTERGYGRKDCFLPICLLSQAVWLVPEVVHFLPRAPRKPTRPHPPYPSPDSAHGSGPQSAEPCQSLKKLRLCQWPPVEAMTNHCIC